jgi:hypothetical protein
VAESRERRAAVEMFGGDDEPSVLAERLVLDRDEKIVAFGTGCPS